MIEGLLAALWLTDLWVLPKRHQDLRPEVEQIVDVTGLRDDCEVILDVAIASERSDRNDYIVVVTCRSPDGVSYRLRYELRSHRLLKGRGGSYQFTEMFDRRWHQAAWVRCEAQLDVKLMHFEQFKFTPPLANPIRFTPLTKDDKPPMGELVLPFESIDPAGRPLQYSARCLVDKSLNTQLQITPVSPDKP